VLYEGASDRHHMVRDILPEGTNLPAVYNIPMPPIGYCVTRVVEWIYGGIPAPQRKYYQHLSREERNTEIACRYKAGESSANLAREFEISDRRIRFLVKRNS
jgi:hypothetical protein